MTSQATICIPSNRPLATSREFLSSAIDYGQRSGMTVVISDNSRDPEKRAFFENGPAHLVYLADAPLAPTENMRNVLAAVDSAFLLMLGDDDRITFADGGVPFDFSRLTDDFVGVKPRIEIWSADKGVTAVNDFTLDAGDAASRMIEYSRKSQGGNSTYYSFFRTREFRDIYNLVMSHHPTKAGNLDWAVVYALAASGKIAHDPATVIRYDNVRWQDFEAASVAMDAIFSAAGLPPEIRAYMLLFHFLDSYVLVLRGSSSLALIERYKSAYAAAMIFLKRLLVRAQERPLDFAPTADLMAPFRQAVEDGDPDLDRIFHIAGLMADRLKPGLKQLYNAYLLAAVRGAAD